MLLFYEKLTHSPFCYYYSKNMSIERNDEQYQPYSPNDECGLDAVFRSMWIENWFKAMLKGKKQIDWRNTPYFNEITTEMVASNIHDIADITAFGYILPFDVILSYHKQNKHFKWYEVTTNKNITMENIFNNPHLPWKYNSIMENPNFNMSIVLEHPEFDWDWMTLSDCSKIMDIDVILHSDLPWDWQILSTRTDVSIHKILEMKHLPWDWNKICRYHKITANIVLENLDIEWNWYELSSNPHLTIDLVLNNLDKPWNWQHVFQCFNNNEYGLEKDIEQNFTVIQQLFVEHLPELFGNCRVFSPSISQYLTMDILKNNMKLSWDWQYLSYSSKITIGFIIENKHLSWDWRGIYLRKDFTIDVAIKNSELNWNWSKLSILHDLTIGVVANNAHLPWDWNLISNRNLVTCEAILRFPQLHLNINWNYVQTREFTTEIGQFISHEVKKTLLAHVLDFYCENRFYEKPNDVEIVFADDYLVKMICEY